MIDHLAHELAKLFIEAAQGEQPIKTMFGTVTSTTVGNMRVRPDSMTTGDMGPMTLLCGTLTLDARVLCLYIPESNVWGIVGK